MTNREKIRNKIEDIIQCAYKCGLEEANDLEINHTEKIMQLIEPSEREVLYGFTSGEIENPQEEFNELFFSQMKGCDD